MGPLALGSVSPSWERERFLCAEAAEPLLVSLFPPCLGTDVPHAVAPLTCSLARPLLLAVLSLSPPCHRDCCCDVSHAVLFVFLFVHLLIRLGKRYFQEIVLLNKFRYFIM